MKQAVDERVAGGITHLSAQAFWLMLAVQAVVLVGKVALGAAFRVCLPDLAVLAAGVVGVAIFRSLKGLWGRKDEMLLEMEEAGLAEGYIWMFGLSVLNTFLFVFGDAANRQWYMPCFAVVLIPAFYFFIRCQLEGVVLWSSKRAEAAGKARMAKHIVLGALVIGLIAGGNACFQSGMFQPSGLWKGLKGAVVWGALCYTGMQLFFCVGKRSADALVKNAETAQEDVSDEE